MDCNNFSNDIFTAEQKISFMKEALIEAQKAFDEDECPIGAIIVKNNEIISRSHNIKMQNKNPLYHAEIVAIERASKYLNSYILDDCYMFVTLEPCTMCAGAIIQSRINKVFFGAFDPKGGAVISCNDIFDKKYGHNHTVEFEGGILQDKCGQILKDFFKKKRK